MSAVLDGNTYQMQFRLHDNRYANSPVSVRVGNGYLRSNILSLGEPGFDPVRYLFSIGVGADKGFSALAGDFAGNHCATHIPLKHEANIIHDNRIMYGSFTVMEISHNVTKIAPAILMRDSTGVDTVNVGYAHMHAMMGMLFNIRTLLREGIDDEWTDAKIDALFSVPPGVDYTRLEQNFSFAYGQDTNMLTYSEVFTSDTVDSSSVTNRALQSRDIQSPFVLTNVTVTLDVAASPRGDVEGDRVTETVASGVHTVEQALTGLTANINYTVHRKVKPNGRTKYRTFFPTTYKTATGAEAKFDLTGNGAVISTTGGSTARILKLDDGWYWIAHTCLGDNSATAFTLTENLLDGTGATSYTGDGVSGVYLDELQVESGVIANPPVDTVGSAVTATTKRAKLEEGVATNFDGYMTLARLTSLIFDDLASAVYIQKTTAVVADQKYCVSAIFKKGTAPHSTLQLLYSGGVHAAEDVVVTINWTTYTVTVVGSNSKWQGGLIPMGNDCYRLWASGPNYDHTTLICRVYVRDKTVTHVYKENVYFGSLMANKGFAPAPYIKRSA